MNLLKSKIIEILEQVFAYFKIYEPFDSLISDIIIRNKTIAFSFDIGAFNCTQEEAIKIREKMIIDISNSIKEIEKVSVVLTSSKSNNSLLKNNKQDIKNFAKKKIILPQIKKIILVAAGKGGVGKSTICSLIAQHLASIGYKIGIIDADIYGPSIPQIFAIKELPKVIDKQLIPIVTDQQIKIMSFGFLLNQKDFAAFRGPMVSKIIYQIFSLTKWGDLDYLFVDMPPGTGDIALSIVENYHLTGAAIVSLPQKLSLIEVEKTIKFYQKFNINILGFIENMSYFENEIGKKIKIFPDNYLQKFIKEYNIPFNISIPLNPKIAEACDEGKALYDICPFDSENFLNILKNIKNLNE